MFVESNPVLKKINKKYQQHHKQFKKTAEHNYSPVATLVGTETKTITYDDITAKTAISLGTVIAAGAVNYSICSLNPSLGLLLGSLGAIVALGVLLVNIFTVVKGKTTNRATVLTFAVSEGAMLGLTIWCFAYKLSGKFPWIAAQALLATIGIFVAMLFIYKNRVIRVTPRFNKIMLSAITGALFVTIGSMLISAVTGSGLTNMLYGGGIISIGVSLLFIVLASLSLLTDFDNAESLVEIGASHEEAWSLALGLTVSIIWLYVEMLRFLSYFAKND